MEPKKDWYYGDEDHPIDFDEVPKKEGDLDLGEEYENNEFWESVGPEPDPEYD